MTLISSMKKNKFEDIEEMPSSETDESFSSDSPSFKGDNL